MTNAGQHVVSEGRDRPASAEAARQHFEAEASRILMDHFWGYYEGRAVQVAEAALLARELWSIVQSVTNPRDQKTGGELGKADQG